MRTSESRDTRSLRFQCPFEPEVRNWTRGNDGANFGFGALAVRELEQRGVRFADKPHLIARMDDHDLWMAFFADPDGPHSGADARGAKRLCPGIAHPSKPLCDQQRDQCR